MTNNTMYIQFTNVFANTDICDQEQRKTGTLLNNKSMVSIADMEGAKNGDIPHEGEGHGDPTLVRTGKWVNAHCLFIIRLVVNYKVRYYFV